MGETLRIELTKAEAKETIGVVAYEFSVHGGEAVIRECWSSYDEVYSDGLTIAIPGRIWAIAAPWLAERAPSPPKIREERMQVDNLPIDRIKDNRLKGLLRELQEAIDDMDDPEALKKLGQSLKMMGDRARNRGWYLLPEDKREFW